MIQPKYLLAYQEMQRVNKLSAFNVKGHETKRKLNQHAVEYKFYDNSVLRIYKRGFATVSWGKHKDIAIAPLNINTI